MQKTCSKIENMSYLTVSLNGNDISSFIFLMEYFLFTHKYTYAMKILVFLSTAFPASIFIKGKWGNPE